jgi:dihydrofolate reductase
MRKLIVFNMMSLDGFIADRKGDMSWAHRQDQEWNSFVAGNAGGEVLLVFGRVTYDMMASYWPTAMARENAPLVARRMNELEKLVFSRTMEKASWQNTTLARGDLVEEVKRLKQQAGADMVILGSASIVRQLTDAQTIDEYQIAVSPVALGGGTSMFHNLSDKANLKLLASRTFKNGNVFLTYQRA